MQFLADAKHNGSYSSQKVVYCSYLSTEHSSTSLMAHPHSPEKTVDVQQYSLRRVLTSSCIPLAYLATAPLQMNLQS